MPTSQTNFQPEDVSIASSSPTLSPVYKPRVDYLSVVEGT